MTENRLQHEIIMWFGQTYPFHQNYLFEVNNNPKNKAHGAHRKAMGMKKNVSDLILIQPKTGKVAGIECNAPGSIWPVQKIENQLNWGYGLINNGGYYLMSSDIELIKQFITSVMENNIPLTEEINTKNKKTIKF